VLEVRIAVPFIYSAEFDRLILLLKVTVVPLAEPMVLIVRVFVAVFNKFVRDVISVLTPVALVMIF